MDHISGNVVSSTYCMNSSSPVSDPYLIQTDYVLSDTSANNDMTHPRCTISDEEIILASDRPKRRAGRKKFKETRHPIYRGVRKRNWNKWVCDVREPIKQKRVCEVREQIKQKRIPLGTYPTADMAARAHDVAALALKGQLATLNFADSIWRLPVPITNDPKDIRKAAVEGTENFRPNMGSEKGPIRVEIDESEINNVLVSMANGPLFSPTPKFGSRFSWDDMDDDVEVSLWSY